MVYTHQSKKTYRLLRAKALATTAGGLIVAFLFIAHSSIAGNSAPVLTSPQNCASTALGGNHSMVVWHWQNRLDRVRSKRLRFINLAAYSSPDAEEKFPPVALFYPAASLSQIPNEPSMSLEVEASLFFRLGYLSHRVTERLRSMPAKLISPLSSETLKNISATEVDISEIDAITGLIWRENYWVAQRASAKNDFPEGDISAYASIYDSI